jgi:hypothetical protein
MAHVPNGFKLGTAAQVRSSQANFVAKAQGQEREQVYLEQTNSGYVPGSAKYFRQGMLIFAHHVECPRC